MSLRTLDADGTLHFTHLKHLALSGVQYLHAVNSGVEVTRDMRIGTIVHFLLLGPRPGAKPIEVYRGGIRRGEKWETFLAENADKEIVTPKEWAEAERMAESVRRSPIAQARLVGAQLEVPMKWEEHGIPCSTSGIDIIPANGDLGDLKSTASTFPDVFERHAFKMNYHAQLAWYRRAARANGMTVRNLFLLGVERKPPCEVVELGPLSPALVLLAEQSLEIWLGKLRNLLLSIPEPKDVKDWPGYLQAPKPWNVPSYMDDEEEDDDDEEEAA